ncbi:Leucine-rich repeat, typical subtype [Nannochloropsis gaditana]|uniref:Leucine-rich repeat, typical subtype n=1 Tax=Nannochloropsis gaditana TaxID=72520 RepID=W7U846_9STRA|nr:Leucine-rich repeat, typical subtype [Nannochloropsis gaditana]
MPSLAHLDLSCNQITALDTTFPYLPSLQILLVPFNRIEDLEGWGQYGSCLLPALRTLDLRDNLLSHHLPPFLPANGNPVCARPGYVSVTAALFRELKRLDGLDLGKCEGSSR